MTKSSVDFLRPDNQRQDYVQIKPLGSKNIYNYKKHQLDEINHSNNIDFFIKPSNTYAPYPFTGSSNFYIDFPLSEKEFLYNQFILRYKLTNNGGNTANLCPMPLIINNVSLLANSQQVGDDIKDWDIFYHNLHKIYNENNNSDAFLLGLTTNSSGQITPIPIPGSSNINGNVELPICLNRSQFPANCFGKKYELRVYFKSNIVYSGANNSDIGLSNVNLVLRMNDMSHDIKSYLFNQKKLNHLFNKRILCQYNINNLTAGLNYSVNLTGFSNVATCLLAWISPPSNDILFSDNGSVNFHIAKYKMDQVYLTDGNGKNLNSNNVIYDYDYNNFLMSNKFDRMYDQILKLTNSLNNIGEIFYLPFCNDNTNPFDCGYFEGGLKFDGTFIFNFVANTSCSTNLNLNVMYFVPTILDLANGNLEEKKA